MYKQGQTTNTIETRSRWWGTIIYYHEFVIVVCILKHWNHRKVANQLIKRLKEESSHD